jgi:hypothetical protein
VNPPVWLVFLRHNTEMEEMSQFVYKKREKIYSLLFRKNLQFGIAMPHNIISTVPIASYQCRGATMHNAPGIVQIESHQFCIVITYNIMAHFILHVVGAALQ